MTEYQDIPSASYDLDNDGFAETTVYDMDHDGLIDTARVIDQASGASVVVVDLDGDGTEDVVLVDRDGDGYADSGYARPGSEAASLLTEQGPGTSSATDPGPGPSDPDDPSDPSVDPSAITDPDAPGNPIIDPFATDQNNLPAAGQDGIHGDPRADIPYHTVQPGPVDCLPTSVSMVLSEVTGTHVPAEDVVAMANDKGFMMSSGMSAENSLELLQSYGVDAHLETGSVDSLRTALDNGDSVIIGLDSADLYQGEGGPFDPGMTSGHAVVLTGIDDGPPAYVYINDPGFPDGAGVQIPLEQFMDAWQDADNVMVVAPAPAGTGGVGTGDDGLATAAEQVATTIRLLPITLVSGGTES